MANTAAQTLKLRAAAARQTQAEANKTKYDALIARMTTLLITAADKGEETFILPSNDADFAAWTSTPGIEYLTAPARGLTAEVITSTAAGKYLQISWEKPNPATI